MRTLVTGGTGFVGLHLVKRLLERGHDVVSPDLNPGPRDGELRERGAVRQSGSVTDAATVDRAMEGVDVVFHLASSFRDISAAPSSYYDVDVNGTRTVLDSAQRHEVRRVVHCSTQGVHGIIENGVGDEDSPIAPVITTATARARQRRSARSTSPRGSTS
ncbi:MAG: NAD-dependent epimerase/dehydratase family protein, partial [Planctomycetota bacterium]|nr:NAD-dependent epimerase/dehydratase family protein [Planctomycetota bacterium]